MSTPTTTADVLARGVPLVVGWGGGVNSTAMLIALWRRGIRPDLITFADTKGEKPETYDFVSALAGWLDRVDFPPLTVVTRSGSSKYASLEDNCLRGPRPEGVEGVGTLPSRAYGFSSCAQKWKIEPQDKFLRHWQPARDAWVGGLKPIKALGYDGGEERRAKRHEDDRLLYWYPLLEWNISRRECKKMIAQEGLPVPLKSACFFCPSSTKNEVLWLAENHPELFERAVAMERNAAGYNTEVKGLGRHWSWEQLLKSDAATQMALPLAPVEACVICDDDSCPVSEDDDDLLTPEAA